ncbi:MAG TPA: cell division protein [Gammaproteobacteria bacterium]|nr:cell division protein [Gammaproteobacteria bacterium]
MTGKTPLLSRLAYSDHGYAIKHSLHYLGTARIATLVTLLVLGISLALPAVFGLVVVNLKRIDVSQDDANSLTLYLHPRVSDLQGVELAGDVQKRSDIRSTRYISRDEALETFRKHSSLADATDTLEDNPLPGAIVAVMAQDDGDESRIRLLSETLSAYPEVELVKYDLNWLKRLRAILALLSRTVVLIGILLVLTALLVIGNTIRLEMLRRSDEITVSRLIGATALQIQRPFLYSGVIYGILGGVLAIALVGIVVTSLSGPAEVLSGLYGSTYKIQGLGLQYSLILLGSSTLIGLVGAWLVARWQMTKILQ